MVPVAAAPPAAPTLPRVAVVHRVEFRPRRGRSARAHRPHRLRHVGGAEPGRGGGRSDPHLAHDLAVAGGRRRPHRAAVRAPGAQRLAVGAPRDRDAGDGPPRAGLGVPPCVVGTAGQGARGTPAGAAHRLRRRRGSPDGHRGQGDHQHLQPRRPAGHGSGGERGCRVRSARGAGRARCHAAAAAAPPAAGSADAGLDGRRLCAGRQRAHDDRPRDPGVRRGGRGRRTRRPAHRRQRPCRPAALLPRIPVHPALRNGHAAAARAGARGHLEHGADEPGGAGRRRPPHVAILRLRPDGPGRLVDAVRQRAVPLRPAGAARLVRRRSRRSGRRPSARGWRARCSRCVVLLRAACAGARRRQLPHRTG